MIFARPPQVRTALAAGVVDLWFLPLDLSVEERQALTESLDGEERMRWSRLRTGGDRWAVAHGARRHVLAAYLDQPPAQLRFERGPLGKPWLLGSMGLRFNSSSRGGLALLAVANGLELGVDLEREDTAADPDVVAREFLSDLDRAAIAAAPVLERRRAFARAWSRHEALRKLHGVGLGDPLPPRTGSAPWVVRNVNAPAGHAAAVAAPDTGWRVRVREFSELLQRA